MKNTETKRKLLGVIGAISLPFLMVMGSACSNDDGGASQPDPKNAAPNAFDLLEVADQDTGVDLRPMLKWESAIDPDGDAVAYEVYLDTNADPSTKLIGNLSDTSFTVLERLSLNKQYYWQVVATDTLGNATRSQVFSFTTRNFLKVVPFTGLSDRMSHHSAAVFNNTIFVTGGYDGNEYLSSVRYWDGDSWNGVSGNAEFEKRLGHTLNSVNGQMVAIGGYSSGIGGRSDVRISEDAFGSRWAKVAEDKFYGRSDHTTTFYQNTWVLMGGRVLDVFFGRAQVAIGNDLGNWEEKILGNVPLRADHTAVVFDGSIWVIGGYKPLDGVTNEVFKINLEDIEETPVEDVPFAPRQGHTSLVYDEKLWVIGGIDESGNALNDVWYCEIDGEWEQMPISEDFGARGNHAAVVFEDKMFIIGGNNGDDIKNDVWVLE